MTAADHGMSDLATPSADPSNVMTLDVTVTLEDHLALQISCLQAPAMQAGQRRSTALTILIAAACAPLALAVGTLIAWAQDRHGPPLGSLLRYLVFDDPGTMVVAALVMVAFVVGGVLLQRWLLRPRMRRLLRRVLRARPDVDPSDPQLAYRARVTVSEEGLESRSGTGVILVRWDALKRWEETGGRFLVLGDAMIGFCLSLPADDPEPLNRLRAVLTARLGPNGAPRHSR